MKTGSKLAAGAVLILVIAIGAVVFLLSNLDGLVKTALEKYGSEATGTAVRVEGVKIGLQSGEGAVSGLTVANPAGFSAPNIFALGNISIAIDTATVTDNPVVIDNITITAPQVSYEIDKAGKSNLDVLKQNLQGTSGSSQPADSSSNSDIKLVIRKLTIEGGGIDARVAALDDKALSTSLPRIVLNDIGKGGGASPAEVAEKVISTLVSKIGPAVANLGLDQYLGKSADDIRQQLEAGVGGKLQDDVGNKLKGAGDSLKGLFGN